MKGNCTLGMAAGLLRNLGGGHKDLEKPEQDLGIVVADISDRESLANPSLEILEAENPLLFKETLQGTLVNVCPPRSNLT